MQGICEGIWSLTITDPCWLPALPAAPLVRQAALSNDTLAGLTSLISAKRTVLSIVFTSGLTDAARNTLLQSLTGYSDLSCMTVSCVLSRAVALSCRVPSCV